MYCKSTGVPANARLCPAAPEVLLTRVRYEAQPADIWSSGVLLYTMLLCRYPFDRPEDVHDPLRHQAAVRRILAGKYMCTACQALDATCWSLFSLV